MDTLEQRIKKIEERNTKVEADKVWEGSMSRKFLIAIFTYVVIGAFLSVIGFAKPWVSAIVPTIGFMFSTLTMPFFKKMWIKYYWSYKKHTL